MTPPAAAHTLGPCLSFQVHGQVSLRSVTTRPTMVLASGIRSPSSLLSGHKGERLPPNQRSVCLGVARACTMMLRAIQGGEAVHNGPQYHVLRVLTALLCKTLAFIARQSFVKDVQHLGAEE